MRIRPGIRLRLPLRRGGPEGDAELTLAAALRAAVGNRYGIPAGRPRLVDRRRPGLRVVVAVRRYPDYGILLAGAPRRAVEAVLAAVEAARSYPEPAFLCVDALGPPTLRLKGRAPEGRWPGLWIYPLVRDLGDGEERFLVDGEPAPAGREPWDCALSPPRASLVYAWRSGSRLVVVAAYNLTRGWPPLG